MHIREFDKHSDTGDLRRCLIELQDFERSLDSRMPSGEQIADDYIPQLLQRCRQCAGKVLLAEVEGKVAGYAAILTKVQSDEIHDGDTEFGLIADLVVLERFRNMGVGGKLLESSESYAREMHVRWLRVGVMAANRVADDLYESSGFQKMYIEREKDLAPASNAGPPTSTGE